MLRRAVAFAIRWSGLAWLVRNTYARGRVSIVLYHDPDPETLARHLAYVGERYTPISLDRLVGALRSGDWSEIPPRSIVITIDDGHAGNARLLEVFERHRVRPTIFICSQIAGTTRQFWFEHLEDLDPERVEELKPVATEQRLAELERRSGFTVDREYGEGRRQALSREEIAAMAAGCDFQSHTRFHPILTSCSRRLAEEEIAGSRAEVEALTGAPCRHLAYPNGSYSEREVALAREAGYESARTVDIGWNGPGADPYRLRILSVADGYPVNMLAADLTGLKWLSRLARRQGGLDGRFRPRWGGGAPGEPV
jgi:peptidoglycan/xylan/chitin deacetylase (PgdA/CDA1 family)